ncbi:uncharacterized protein LOC120329976 [Styela clava]
MKIFVTALAVLGLISNAYGLTCFTCSDTNGYDGESSLAGVCFQTSTTGTTTSTATCLANSGSTVYYCRTMFSITDGVVTGVSRGCASSTGDEDVNTNAVPGNNKCVSVLDVFGNPTDATDCYYHCTSDDCNSLTTSSLRQCSTDCNVGSGGGRCNYIVGSCVCNSGFTGTDCTTTTTVASTVQRRCVQCNSATDTGCATSTTSVDCPGSETYCSTATTSIYSAADTVVASITTRGCTSAYKAVDECSFTNIYTDAPISDSSVGYNEFTCYSTCDTDGCNTNSADGIVNGNEAIALQCVVCSDTTGSGSCNSATSRQTCPSGSTHCKSTVVYMLSDRADLAYTGATPAYKLVSVVRECATAAVTSACTDSSIGTLSLKKVTCSETCQGDGCNTGWPARPKCISCVSSPGYTDGYDECLTNPPEAADCTYPYEGFCVIHESGMQEGTSKSVAGYPRRMTRGCTYYDIGTGCTSQTIRSTPIQTCNRTCTTDGCNVGNGSSMTTQTMIAVFIPALLGWMAKLHL